jgi:hypothetical protein
MPAGVRHRRGTMLQAIGYAAFIVVMLGCLWFIADSFDNG